MITVEEYKHLTPDQRQRIKEEINNRMGEYLTTRCGISNPARSGNFECPVCHHREMHYYPDTNKVRCFSGKGCHDEQPYDLIDLIGKLRGISGYNDKLFTAINELGISIPAAAREQKTQGAPVRSDQRATDQQQPQRKAPNPEGVKMFVRQAAAAMPSSKAELYMISRGFDPDFLKEMRIGYDDQRGGVVIPYSVKPDQFFDYYVIRYIDPVKDDKGKERRFYKPLGISEPLFHADNLSNDMPYVFVCEAQIDALSIEQAGGNAIAIGSTNNTNKLLSYLQDHPDKNVLKSKKTFVIAFDHDDAGIPAEKKLIDDLKNAGYAAISANDAGLYDYTEALTEYEIDKMTREKEQGRIPKKIKDINELLQGDPNALTVRIERMISKPADVYRDSFSMGSFRSEYQQQRERNSSSPRISTGFKHLDEVLGGGLRPSLIFIGAITSIGKTTLVMQIADSIAKQGRDVIIFALEMSRFELVSRSISRESYRLAKAQQTPQPGNALTFYEISDGLPLTAAKTNILKQAEDHYFKVIAPHIFIVEGEGSVTAESIRQQVQTHTELTGASPVVIVDYLQLLQPPKDAYKLSDKQVVDINTMALKHISRDGDFSTPVIAVMSLNRAAYNEDVSLSSGKESGAIEYGCDILLGMNQEKENDDGSRSIYIDILKHRGGKKDRRVTFEYTPAYSSFRDTGSMRIPKKKPGSEAPAAAGKSLRKGEQDADGRTVL